MELLVVVAQAGAVLCVLGGGVGVGEQRQQVGAARGVVAVDDLLHDGEDAYVEAAAGLVAAVGDVAVGYAGGGEVGYVDKGHAAGAVAEDEEAAS